MICPVDFILFQLTNLLVCILFVVVIITTSITAMLGNCIYRGGLCFDCSTEKKVPTSQSLQFKYKTMQVSGGPMCSNDHQEGLWSSYAKLFSRLCKYHNKGRLLSRYLKENSNFHFANINGAILQVLSAKWI